MSGAIIPANGTSNFQQQGQLDWVSLTRYTFGDVFGRISKAGLDLNTIAVGGMICSGFANDREAHKRISKALFHLKSFSSYGKIVWFGFGIKHVVTDLAESEQGAACVALCACLSVSYDPFYAAQVLGELCRIRGALGTMIPSIHQWTALVNSCAGAISYSKFPILLEGLMHHIVSRNDKSIHHSAPPEALANALGALAELSSGKLADVTFIGGLDCLWLAAVSEWLLSLKVEICLTSGKSVYESPGTHINSFPVKVIFDWDNRLQTQPILTNKSYVIPKGRKLWSSPGTGEYAFIGGRSEWSTILKDTFGPCIDTLRQENVRQSFALVLMCASRQAESNYRREPHQDGLPYIFSEFSRPFRRFHFGHKSSKGEAFLTFAAQRLPELAFVVETLRQFEDQLSAGLDWRAQVGAIQLACKCYSCQTKGLTFQGFPEHLCLRLVTETIVSFLWMLSATDVDESLRPSSHGLRLLYEQHQEKIPHESDILMIALEIFAGTVGNEVLAEISGLSALSYNGICVYFRALEDLSLGPEEASTVRVIRGHIEFEGTRYRRIRDLLPTNKVVPPTDAFEQITSYELIAKETPQPDCIAISYQLSDGKHSRKCLLGISKLEHAIAISIQAPIRCRNIRGRKFCRDWNFPHHPRETLTFTPKISNLQDDQNLASEEESPRNLQWSLVSVPGANTDKPIDLRVVKASICRLYLKIANGAIAYRMTDLHSCLTCIVKLSYPSQVPAKATLLPPKSRHLSHRPKGTITVPVPSPSQTDLWLEKTFEISLKTDPSSALEEAFMAGDKDFVQILRERRTEVETKDSDGKTALHKVATLGHEGMLQLLLQGKASVNAVSIQGKTALHFAAQKGHKGTVELLLENGAELGSTDKFGQTPLSLAAGSGHGTAVKLLIDKGANLDSQDRNGRTPLSWAAANGHEVVVKLLVEEGAHLDSKDSSGQTPLSRAAENGHTAVVELLFEKGADLDSKPGSGRTPLSLAAGNGRETVVELLFEKGADLASQDRNGRTPLSLAAANNCKAVVELLIKKGANLNSEDNSGQTPLSWAASNGHDTVVKLLLEEGADVDSKDNSGWTPLSWSAASGHKAVAELLLENGADIDATDKFGRTPLSWTALTGRGKVAEPWLEGGADLDSQDGSDRTPLSSAAGNGCEAVALLLLKKGANIESRSYRGQTPLSFAARNGSEAVAKLLLEKGADPDSKDNTDRTPLSCATESGHEAVAELLIKGGANLESKSHFGQTPLSLAAEGGHEAVVKLLLKNGADLDSRSNYGRTPLSLAAGKGHKSVLNLLIEMGADPDSKSDAAGRTPLSFAAERGHAAVVEVLLEHGVDLDSKDNSGRTPLSLAARNGHEAAVELLLEKGADLDSEDNNGLTPLMLAADTRREAVVKLLKSKT